MRARIIIQIAALPESVNNHDIIIALCNDGSLWTLADGTAESDTNDWHRIANVPQPETDND